MILRGHTPELRLPLVLTSSVSVLCLLEYYKTKRGLLGDSAAQSSQETWDLTATGAVVAAELAEDNSKLLFLGAKSHFEDSSSWWENGPP